MSRKKVKTEEVSFDSDTIGDIADVVWVLSQSSSTPEEKAAAAAKAKLMGFSFATPIRVNRPQSGDK